MAKLTLKVPSLEELVAEYAATHRPETALAIAELQAKLLSERPRLGVHTLQAWVADPSPENEALAIETLKRCGPLVLRNGEPDEQNVPGPLLYKLSRTGKIMAVVPVPNYRTIEDDTARGVHLP